MEGLSPEEREELPNVIRRLATRPNPLKLAQDQLEEAGLRRVQKQYVEDPSNFEVDLGLPGALAVLADRTRREIFAREQGCSAAEAQVPPVEPRRVLVEEKVEGEQYTFVNGADWSAKPENLALLPSFSLQVPESLTSHIQSTLSIANSDGAFVFLMNAMMTTTALETTLPLLSTFFKRGGKLVVVTTEGEIENLGFRRYVHWRETVKEFGGGFRALYAENWEKYGSAHAKTTVVVTKTRGQVVLINGSGNFARNGMAMDVPGARTEEEAKAAPRSIEGQTVDNELRWENGAGGGWQVLKEVDKALGYLRDNGLLVLASEVLDSLRRDEEPNYKQLLATETYSRSRKSLNDDAAAENQEIAERKTRCRAVASANPATVHNLPPTSSSIPQAPPCASVISPAPLKPAPPAFTPFPKPADAGDLYEKFKISEAESRTTIRTKATAQLIKDRKQAREQATKMLEDQGIIHPSAAPPPPKPRAPAQRVACSIEGCSRVDKPLASVLHWATHMVVVHSELITDAWKKALELPLRVQLELVVGRTRICPHAEDKCPSPDRRYTTLRPLAEHIRFAHSTLSRTFVYAQSLREAIDSLAEEQPSDGWACHYGDCQGKPKVLQTLRGLIDHYVLQHLDLIENIKRDLPPSRVTTIDTRIADAKRSVCPIPSCPRYGKTHSSLYGLGDHLAAGSHKPVDEKLLTPAQLTAYQKALKKMKEKKEQDGRAGRAVEKEEDEGEETGEEEDEEMDEEGAAGPSGEGVLRIAGDSAERVEEGD